MIPYSPGFEKCYYLICLKANVGSQLDMRYCALPLPSPLINPRLGNVQKLSHFRNIKQSPRFVRAFTAWTRSLRLGLVYTPNVLRLLIGL